MKGIRVVRIKCTQGAHKRVRGVRRGTDKQVRGVRIKGMEEGTKKGAQITATRATGYE